MITKKKKNQKPTEISASFKYTCPNTDCGFNYWLFLREVQTKNFKIVCDCGTIFKPKLIKKIKIVYHASDPVKETLDKAETSDKIRTSQALINSAINTMVGLGYKKQEAKVCIELVCESEIFVDHFLIVKKAISKIGGL
jgi:hypothetical protein